MFDRCSSVTSCLQWFHFSASCFDEFQRKKKQEKKGEIKKKKIPTWLVALLIKSRTGPSQPDLGGKERGGEEKRKRGKEGKGRNKEEGKEKLPLSFKMCRWWFNSDAFFYKNVWLSAHPCSLLNATRVLLSVPAARSWLNYAKYVEA